MKVETVNSSSSSSNQSNGRSSSLLLGTGVMSPYSPVEDEPIETTPAGAIDEVIPPDITYTDDGVDVNSTNSTITGPPTWHFRNQPTDEETEKKASQSDSSVLPEQDGVEENDETDNDSEVRRQFDSLWNPEANGASTSTDLDSSPVTASASRPSLYDDPTTPQPRAGRKSAKQPPQPPPSPPSSVPTSNTGQRGKAEEDSDATPVMKSPNHQTKKSVGKSLKREKKKTPAAMRPQQNATLQESATSSHSGEGKQSAKKTPRTSNSERRSFQPHEDSYRSRISEVDSATTNPESPTEFQQSSRLPANAARKGEADKTTGQSQKKKPAKYDSSQPSQRHSMSSSDKSSKDGSVQSEQKRKAKQPATKRRRSASAPAKDAKKRSPERQKNKARSNRVVSETASSISSSSRDKSVRSDDRNRSKMGRGTSSYKPKSPTSVADDSWLSFNGHGGNGSTGSRRKTRSPNGEERKYDDMDSQSFPMQPSSFSQIPISADMTPEEWKVAQQQIQFLENELDKVTALCLELTQSIEEEEKTDREPPPGDWIRAQQQVRYLEQELETVTELCDLLTRTAEESTEAIEMLEEEKAKLEALIRRLEKALDEKDAMIKKRDLVEENESACCCYCWNWIPEPVVWFVSFLYRVD
eukprot:scaffold7656_cov104-Cylindrotheca_fusiformis.AAC.4